MKNEPNSTRPPLRVGLSVDSLHVPAWMNEVVAEIAASDWAEIALIVRANEQTRQQTASSNRKGFRHLCYNLYTWFDERQFGPSCQPNAFEPNDVTRYVQNAPQVEVAAWQSNLDDHAAAHIREASLDVLIHCGAGEPPDEMASAAQHGVWHLQRGNADVESAGLAGFWEVMDGHPTVEAVVQMMTARNRPGVAIERFVGVTDVDSVAKNRHNLYWKSGPMLCSALRRLHEHGVPVASRNQEPAPSPRSTNQLANIPANGKMTRCLARLMSRGLRKKASHVLRFDQFMLAYRFRQSADDENMAFDQYHQLVPPKDRFWADPFLVERDGRYFVFFEECPFHTVKAHISMCEIDRQGTYSTPQPVLERPYHLSYPFVFEYEGELMMIPESAQNRTIELYRCRQFPDKWELHSVLMKDLNAVDTTLFEQDGRWWMFVCIVEKGLPNRDILHLFHAQRPTGPWLPHRRNPVKRNALTARPAGHLFRRDGKLFRPTQECAPRYGAAICINEVIEFTDQKFVERVAWRVTPDWGPRLLGTHTINTVGDVTIIDVEMLRHRFL